MIPKVRLGEANNFHVLTIFKCLGLQMMDDIQNDLYLLMQCHC